MALIFLRHAPIRDAAGLCYGQFDVAAEPVGAAELASLAASLGKPARILTSPLSRCQDLALPLGRHLGQSPIVDVRLAEMDFGRWEGRPWTEIPRSEIDEWAADVEGARPHRGESVAMLGARVSDFIRDVQGRAGDSLVVTHLGVVRAALRAVGRVDALETRLGFCEALRLEETLE
ncbi:histidine phosphatase family protein [Pacificimonas flava]|uniref:Alpha-ribazole-5'-phosphate phosphatase n=1 Tax=Pacificimonas flava TaxID=1234595 RepID=M2U4E6_9SPHN|nr:histidine phosphatase family protein [Pacificimonas flava]EMD82833.1 Alpha-ribazole-5'-phosphate phosphatase [Pacificimonas flava]MBB5279448.1 alpha-ribazole phosphatase [Pacificimonas flava]